MTPIYELSEALTHTLTVAANGDSPVFALIEPRSGDTPDRIERLGKQLKEVNDLVNLDLLKDISPDFLEQVEHCKVAHGFGYKVFTLTDIGLTMFKTGAGKKGIN